jgi:transposase InsO family protein
MVDTFGMQRRKLMPFKECSLMALREEFCLLAARPGVNLRDLCRRFGVSPQTGYKWLGRFEQEGAAGLSDRSRRPHLSPGRTVEALEVQVLAVRQAHPAWGGRKIRRVLQDDGVGDAPSASTITAILRRHGRLDGPGAGEQRAYVRFEHDEPNDLWQMDFKGHFALERGRCHPLTVLDDHSRYALEIAASADEQLATVQSRLERLFRVYGLPRRILADNSPPWGTGGGPGLYTRLGVWLWDLDVGLIHGRPYHPQTQGKDERFHRTLKAEVLAGRTFETLGQAQAAFDAWRSVYNTRRPHEALAMDTPSSRYAVSPRPMPHSITPPVYEPQAQVRTVSAAGWFMFKGRRIDLSHAFAGKRIALRPTHTDGLFDICYRTHVLAQVNLRHDIIKTVHHVPEHPSTLSPV